MPLPPERVQIKRKRDEDPVDFLHVHNEVKKARLQEFVFRRARPTRTKATTATPNAPTSKDPLPTNSNLTGQNFNGPPIVQTSQPGDELRDGRIRGFTKPATGSVKDVTGLNLKPAGTQTPESVPDVLSAASREPRRFHMTRSAPPSTARSFVTGVPNRKQAAIFIERRQPVKHGNKLLGEALSRQASQTSLKTQSKEPSAIPAVSNLANEVSTPPLTPVSAKARAPLRNVKQASGKVITSSASEAELEEAMQAYTMDNIGRALAEASTPARKPPASPFVPRSSSSRFKPKAPALRYHERHPPQPTAVDQPKEEDIEMEIDDEDSEYIIDTYIRVPSHMVASEESLENAGLLVLDAQSDVDEFYNDDSDDDSEIYDEEEDENAENHPSTDYPDEEVDSDDEFGRNPYLFRNRNASDEEEFDEDDATFSDDDSVVGTTKSWSKRPPWMRAGAKTLDDEDEEDD